MNTFGNIKRNVNFFLNSLYYYFKNTSNLPLVSIIIPLYNDEIFLRECILSIRKQYYKNIECIIVDDASTDNSYSIAQKFVGEDIRFKIISHEKNLGLPSARNTGLKASKGKYVTFLDSDDYLLQHAILRRVLILENNKRSHIGGSHCQINVGPEHGAPKYTFLKQFIRYNAREINHLSTNGDCPFNAHAPLLIREVIMKFNGFNEAMRYGAEDWDLWNRILRHGYIFVPSFHLGGIYRQKKKSMARQLVKNHCTEAMRLLNEYNSKASGLLTPCPFHYSEGISYYNEVIAKTKRLINYYSLAVLKGDNLEAKEIEGLFVKKSQFYLERAISVGYLVDQAIAKYNCINIRDYYNNIGSFREQKALIVNKINQLII